MLRSCARTGQCCKILILAFSPKQLKESYTNWRDSKVNTVSYHDIHLIYPMLASTCKGKTDDGRFAYGPCKNYIESGGSNGCSIHDIKPRMCKGYPYYENAQAIEMGGEAKTNPGSMKGCGFNADANHGKTVQEILSSLKPLEEGEKE